MPFLDFDWEPPLCAAVRLGCSTEMVELLLEHGANVTDVDASGRTPLGLLSSRGCAGGQMGPDSISGVDIPAWVDSWPLPASKALLPMLEEAAALASAKRQRGKARSLAVASLLIAAGADPLASGILGFGDFSGGTRRRASTCVELARNAGNEHLEELYLQTVS